MSCCSYNTVHVRSDCIATRRFDGFVLSSFQMSVALSVCLFHWMVFSTYVAFTYVVSLRGNEGFLLDLGGLLDIGTKETRNTSTLNCGGKKKARQTIFRTFSLVLTQLLQKFQFSRLSNDWSLKN